MAITATDIQYFYSMGNTGATGASTAAASLGGTVSTTEVTAGANNLWDDISSAEATAGRTEYRCIYVKNNHGSLAWQSCVVWVDAGDGTPAGTDLDVALDPQAAGTTNSSTTIANETTAPGGVTFANTAISKGTGLSIGNIAAGARKAIWLKRTITAGAAAASATPSIRVEGDTAP